MKNNKNAMAAFMENLTESKKLLETLTAFVEDHMGCDPDTINWGDVGSAGHLADILSEAVESFGLKKN